MLMSLNKTQIKHIKHIKKYFKITNFCNVRFLLCLSTSVRKKKYERTVKIRVIEKKLYENEFR